MVLDRNYNIKVQKKNPYTDEFDEMVELIAQAKEEGEITDAQAAFILNVAIKKRTLSEVKYFFNSLGDFRTDTEQADKHTLFIQFLINDYLHRCCR